MSLVGTDCRLAGSVTRVWRLVCLCGWLGVCVCLGWGGAGCQGLCVEACLEVWIGLAAYTCEMGIGNPTCPLNHELLQQQSR